MVGAQRNYQVQVFFHVLNRVLNLSVKYQISFGNPISFVIYVNDVQRHLVLDKTCMFTVFTERDNKPWKHSVKALQIIWNHFPQL